MKTVEAEYVVVGSGPAGASLAKSLATLDKDVVLVEMGTRKRSMGTARTMSKFMAGRGLFERSQDGSIIERAIALGGTTIPFAGTAVMPPKWLSTEYAIDLSAEVGDTMLELNPQTLPEDRLGEGTLRLMEASKELGAPLETVPKMIDLDKCRPGCDQCIFGCKFGAKWTALDYIEQAENAGAKVLTGKRVKKVYIRKGAKGREVAGVECSGKTEVMGSKVILCAGGIGSPRILQSSGIEAGKSLHFSPLAVVMAIAKNGGNAGEIPYTVSYEGKDARIGNLSAPYAIWAQALRFGTLPNVRKILGKKKVLGMFAMIDDDPNGQVNADGSFHKRLSDAEWKKLSKGVKACEKIMVKAGADPKSVHFTWNVGGQPGGTAALGTVVERDFQVKDVHGLYVCDASILPRPAGAGNVITLIAMAKRLAARLV